MTGEDCKVLIVFLFLILPIMAIFAAILYDGVRETARSEGWISGYIAAKKENRRVHLEAENDNHSL